MNQVAVVGFAQYPNVPSAGTTSGVELLVPVFQEVLADLAMSKQDIDFWCSGSSDYLAGRAFSFVNAVDAIGAYPPIVESHVEMDAAWALYEAYVKLLTGEAETALVYGFGKSSAGQLRRILALQLDPYLHAPLWPDSVSVAALQARLGIEAGLYGERDMAEVAAASRAAARDNPKAQVSGVDSPDTLLKAPYVADPLRAHDCAPVTDGAAAVVLAAGDRARALRERPAWITGFAHRVDSPALGARDLTTVPSATAAAEAAGLRGDDVDVVELHAPFTHQQLLLTRALGLGESDGGGARINPSGGVLCGNPMFSAGLSRIGAAAEQVMSGRAGRAAAHATSGPALQQNLVCVLEGA
ncbi:thiolase domain-containing protein [Phytohabitans rumicis]|uniref:Lipid-transfer protein n=1 Tax=Phytohabitans rumicis TaxID=1076125 RepID=A0A6V8LN17_9ACTN|nr:thiolase domain-containing protein [Phytohabitans rumicis]GFJ96401.1 lipid-transfer protein [Phytohabitans rumicis]